MSRLSLEHIVGQIREDLLLAAIEAGKQMPRQRPGRLFPLVQRPRWGCSAERERNELDAGRPALYIRADRVKLVGRERQLAGLKERLHLVGRKAQVGGA